MVDEVTLARLETKVDGLHDKIDELTTKVDKLNGSVRAHETEIARLQERNKVGALLQGAFTIVASAVAGFLGVQR